MTLCLTAFITIVGSASPSRQDIGQTIRDAVEQAKREAAQAARDAQEEVRDAQQELRDAQQEVRQAQQELRNARTGDQRGEANQAMQDAQEQLRDAQNELRRAEARTRSTPIVYAGPPPDFPRSGIPAGAMDIAIGFFITCAVIVVGWPISRAFGRRLERRGASPVVEAGVTDQLQRIEQAVEAMAIEVERISESQRYLTKIQDKSASTLE
jgi:flagellar biosynthesis GTPase FlhF